MKSSMHIELYYGNKTNVNLTNFSANIGELQSGKIIFAFFLSEQIFCLLKNFELIWIQLNRQSIHEHNLNKQEQLIV
jgi:hypothetical protein